MTSSPPAPFVPFDGTVLRPDGTIGVYRASSSTPLRLTLDAIEGLTYQIDIVPIGVPDFELTTALR